MIRWAPALALSVACTAGGLGDAAFRGAPIATLPMLLFEPPPAERTALAVFWADRIAEVADGGQFFEHLGSAIHLTGEETVFSFPLFEPPPAHLIHDGPQGARIAVGVVAGYVDADGDLRHDPGERLIGSVDPMILVFLPEAVDATRSPTGLPLPAGYHGLHSPLLCEPFPAVTPGDCGVPLGALCDSDAECGTGTCQTEMGIDRRTRGACVIHEPPADGCRPSDGRLRLRPRRGPGGIIGDWVLQCAVDADCPRAEGDRTVFCLPSNGICRAAAHWTVKFQASLPDATFCFGE